MAFVTTPGANNATSFATLGQAIQYQRGQPGASAWLAAYQEIQEAFLEDATLRLSLTVPWFGSPVAPLTQALPLPMLGQVDAFGRALALTVIPPLVVQATARYALVLFNQAQRRAREARGITQLNVSGDVAITYADPLPVSNDDMIPRFIWQLLRLYGQMPPASWQVETLRT